MSEQEYMTFVYDRRLNKEPFADWYNGIMSDLARRGYTRVRQSMPMKSMQHGPDAIAMMVAVNAKEAHP